MTNGTPADDPSAIYGLLGDERYGNLLDFAPPFNLFDALEVGLNENPSSRVLAYLLTSDNPHGLGTAFLETWLNEVFLERAKALSERRGRGLSEAREGVLLKLLGAGVSRSVAQVEWSPPGSSRRVDILIRVYDRIGQCIAVLGVENKHWAGEQEDQVKDYQAGLAQAFPDDAVVRCLLFLTPYGRDASTADSEHGASPYVPCIPCGYQTVLRTLRRMGSKASPHVALFLSSVSAYLANSMDLEDMDEKSNRVRSLVGALYANEGHRKAIDLLVQYMPSGRAMAMRLESRVRNEFEGEGVKLEFGLYPSRGPQLREAMWSLPLAETGLSFPLVLMLRPFGNDYWKSGTKIFACVLASLGKDPNRTDLEDRLKEVERLRGRSGLALSKAEIDSWTWAGWKLVCLSQRAHELGALQEDDVEGLCNLTVETVRSATPDVQECFRLA